MSARNSLFCKGADGSLAVVPENSGAAFAHGRERFVRFWSADANRRAERVAVCMAAEARPRLPFGLTEAELLAGYDVCRGHPAPANRPPIIDSDAAGIAPQIAAWAADGGRE